MTLTRLNTEDSREHHSVSFPHERQCTVSVLVSVVNCRPSFQDHLIPRWCSTTNIPYGTESGSWLTIGLTDCPEVSSLFNARLRSWQSSCSCSGNVLTFCNGITGDGLDARNFPPDTIFLPAYTSASLYFHRDRALVMDVTYSERLPPSRLNLPCRPVSWKPKVMWCIYRDCRFLAYALPTIFKLGASFPEVCGLPACCKSLSGFLDIHTACVYTWQFS